MLAMKKTLVKVMREVNVFSCRTRPKKDKRKINVEKKKLMFSICNNLFNLPMQWILGKICRKDFLLKTNNPTMENKKKKRKKSLE